MAMTTRSVRKSVPKVCKRCPHGMLKSHTNVINPDLLAFVKG
jgi:hypothetical protein